MPHSDLKVVKHQRLQAVRGKNLLRTNIEI